MVKVAKYNDFSDAKNILEIPEGLPIKDCFVGLDWNNYAVFANGVKVDENYIPDAKDFIVIRSIPHLTGVSIAIAVIAVAVGVYAGVTAYKANKEAEKAKKEMERLQRSTKNDVTNLPWLKGAENTVATGKTQPYIMGTHLFTPYILNSGGNYKGYSTIEGTTGEKQYYNVVLEGGFNKQALSRLYCDDITLRNFDGVTAQEGIFSFEDNSPFSGKNSFIEIAQDGEPFETDAFNKKIVESVENDELKKRPSSPSKDGIADDNYEDLFYTLEPNTRAADVCIMFNGLFHTNENGTRGQKTRHILPYYSTDYAELVARGDPDADSKANWQLFSFQLAQWHDAVITTHSGSYSYEYKGITINKKLLLSHINEWKFVNGEDVRNDYDSLEFSYKVTKGIQGGLNYTVNINLKKTTTSEGYYDGEIDTNEISGLYNKQVRFNAHVDFTFDEVKNLNYPVTIKVTSPDREPENGSDTDSCYIEWIHSYLYNKTKSDAANAFIDERVIEEREARLSTLIGLHIESTTANEDKLKSIQVITSGMARTWDGEKWSDDKVVTSNPASWLIEVLTTNAHTPSQLDDSEIDFDTFAELYEECERKGYYINYVITSGMVKSAVLEMLCNVAHCVLYQNIYGQIAVALDNVKENANFILNEQNLISFSYTTDLTRQPDGVVVSFVNADKDYQQDSIIVMYDGRVNPSDRAADCVLTSINCEGVTTYEQAYRYALYKMRCVTMRAKTVTAQVGREALYYTPLSKVLVTHPSLKNGLGNGEIKNVIRDEENNIIGLQLYGSVKLDLTNTYNVVIQCVNNRFCAPLAAEIKGFDGVTNEIEFVNPIPESANIYPCAGNILSYGYEVETITNPMLITAIAPTNDGYNLTLVDYNEKIFDDDYEIPDYESNITTPRSPLGSLPREVPSVYPTIEQVAEIAKENAQQMRVLSSLLDEGVKGEVAIYNGAFFRYSGEYWLRLDASGYLGTKTTLPETATIDSFFLSLFEGTIETVLTLYNGDGLELYNGELLNISIKAKRGVIYYCDALGWHEDSNRNSYRYIMALSDLALNGFALPDALPEIIQSGEPCYLGALTNNPTTFKNEDWFVWAGETTADFTKGEVYKLKGGAWVRLNQADTNNAKELMTCLSDLLKVNNAGTGYFSTIFSNALITNEAFINKLAASVIRLQSDAEGNKGVIFGGNRYKADGTDNDVNASGFYLNEDGILKVKDAIINGSISAGTERARDELGYSITKEGRAEFYKGIWGGTIGTTYKMPTEEWNPEKLRPFEPYKFGFNVPSLITIFDPSDSTIKGVFIVSPVNPFSAGVTQQCVTLYNNGTTIGDKVITSGIPPFTIEFTVKTFFVNSKRVLINIVDFNSEIEE